uniref:T9SS type A sorting domain-containing protein n=1 Tax=candidate division WOR-3 bacterium TaxID=2052148 RepID=A0A7C4GFP5_UNCW3
MRSTLLLTLLLPAVVFCQLVMKRTCLLQSGLWAENFGRVLCCDSDHDGLQELIFATGTILHTDPLRWEVWESRPVNRYELVFADTGAYPYPPGITTGNFRPFDVGDIDGDGLTDLLGFNRDFVPTWDSLYDVLAVMESPDSASHPKSMVWWTRYAHATGGTPPRFTPDLDRDGRREILFGTRNETLGAGIWENVANDSNVLVWRRLGIRGYSLTFGDFDRDSSREFVTADIAGLGVSVYECTGDNQYELIFLDTMHLPNAPDVWSGRDLDQDGRPEFFVRFWVIPYNRFYLYMWEGAGNNTYQRTLIDEKLQTTRGASTSICGDLDGDGIEELVWALPLQVFIYKAVGDNQFREVWRWLADHGTHECLITNVADMNGNGYNDLVIAGSGKTSVFEVEAIRVLYPNRERELHSGDTCRIRWRIYAPPRCDSVSLFLKTDTVVPQGQRFWRLDTIVTGLSPQDSVFPWVVPAGGDAPGRIVAIAYGPGWQFDESDSAFRIVPGGVTEGRDPRLEVASPLRLFPNPARNRVRLAGAEDAVLFTPDGRRVAALSPGGNDIRHLAPGVYFCRVTKTSESVRLVLVE